MFMSSFVVHRGNTMLRGEIYALLITCLLGVKSFPRLDSSLGIAGGNSVNITEVPFMAQYCGGPYDTCCGAAIVHPRFLITTAWCYFSIKNQKTSSYVIVGTDKVYTEGEVYDVEDGYLHPAFLPVPFELEFDIAVLKLAKPLKFNERINSIQLAEEDFVVPEEAMFDTMGFGATYNNIFDLKFPDQLQKVTVPYVAPEICKRRYRRITKKMICAGAEWKGNCYGDDAAPLIYKNTLVGVLNKYDNSCGEKDRYNVFTYIPEYRHFIDGIIEHYA